MKINDADVATTPIFYKRAVLVSTLVTHRRTDDPGRPTIACCHCGWTARLGALGSWAAHLADRYETAAARHIDRGAT